MTPINAIGEDNLPGFVDSLVFTEFGLASLDGRFLAGLTVTEAYRLLKLFGWEQYTAVFREDLEVASALDRELLAKLQSDNARLCPPMEPQSGEFADEAGRCYDPRCIVRNSKCTAPATCSPWNGAQCNICRC